MKGKVSILGKYIWLLLFLAAGFVICTLCSCKTKYIETIREVYVNNTDTFIQHDSVKTEINTILREARPEDSAMIAQLGIRLQNNERLLILMQKQLQEKSKEKYEHKVDTFIQTDSIKVPVPVEKELTKWEKFTMNVGKFTYGALTAGLIIFLLWLLHWIRRKDK